MFGRLVVSLLKGLPHHLISRWVGTWASIEFPTPLQHVINEGFARIVGLDRREARRPLWAYDSLEALFVRRLDPSARSIEARAPHEVVVPVDGTLKAFGPIQGGSMFRAKGISYDLIDLLDSERAARRFRGGRYATFYLSPRDYHRIHSPVTGEVVSTSYIPGRLFPVHPWVAEHLDDLFAVNERLITSIETVRWGRVGLVKIGAMCVGQISLTFETFEAPRRFRHRHVERHHDVSLDSGDPVGAFHLGSTVIVLFEPGDFQFRPELEPDREVQMGERLGHFS